MTYLGTASPPDADARYEPIPQPPSHAPSVEASSTEVLITEQEVLFSTAAAVLPRREGITRRLAASIGRMFAVAARPSPPRRRDYPKRYEFLERALMGREMDRL